MATVTLGGSLSEKLIAISQAGFQGVELVEKDLLNFKGSARYIRSLSEDLGLNIIAFQPLRDFEGCPAEIFQERLDCAERMFDTMAELGTPMLLMCSNVSTSASPDLDRMANDLTLLAERARQRGVKVAYEALSWGTRIRTYREAWRLVQRVSHPNLGLALDTFHTFCLDDDLTDLLSIPPEHIFLVQIADAPRISLDLLQWSRRFRCLPGSGNFDLAAFLAPLFANHYEGPLSLEIFSDIYPSLPPQLVAMQGFSSLRGLEVAAASSGLMLM